MHILLPPPISFLAKKKKEEGQRDKELVNKGNSVFFSFFSQFFFKKYSFIYLAEPGVRGSM